MVEAVRAGSSQRAVARQFGVSLATVQLWLKRAAGGALEQVDWTTQAPIARHVRRTGRDIEDRIIDLRRVLREESILGEYGPVAIRRALEQEPDLSGPLPAVRTIARILERRGALDASRRVRRPAPAPGWYIPEVRRRQVELDSFDVISGLRLRGGLELDILTGVSLHGGLPAAWPTAGVSAQSTVAALEGHWRRVGLPGFAQFDNDTRFIGGNRHPNSIGPVIRYCLAIGVGPVFAPPRETGFQAAIEAFNGRWQRKLWARFWDPGLADLEVRSDVYITASRARLAARIDAAPDRLPFPVGPRPALDRAPAGRLLFMRRTNEQGSVSILGRRYPVDERWLHRLVRCELDLDARRLRYFALRRREPEEQPLLGETPFEPPTRWSQ
jgi:transposase-like protein